MRRVVVGMMTILSIGEGVRVRGGVRMMLASMAAVRTRETPREQAARALREAFQVVLQQPAKGIDVVPTLNPDFGDYQCNAAMRFAKVAGRKPRDIAEDVIANLKLPEGVFEKADIAGAGFINLRLTKGHLVERLAEITRDKERCGVDKLIESQKEKIVVDFSSPNIAKEMHVGHLRSTIIGDTISRVLEFRGHDVLRLNHVGDWGTQFGMLIRHLKERYPDVLSSEGGVPQAKISDLVQFYREAKARFDDDKAFQDESRDEVVKLQNGDEGNLRAWKMLCQCSRQEFQKVYDILNVTLEERGESFYNSLLSSVVEELADKNLAIKSEGAMCVFLEGYKTRDGKPQPLIVQKTDGGFMYSTTDLAAIRHRCLTEEADRILYVTDSGQSLHFQQVFETARLAGMTKENVRLEHVPFGLVQGEDGKKFKTRSGDTVKLMDLLTEAVKRATAEVEERFIKDGKEVGLESEHIGRILGISAVKYADLSMNRESNYKFSFSKMLALQGNTAPYMLYAYARIQGIGRKAAASMGLNDIQEITGAQIIIEDKTEYSLSRKLVYFPELLIEIEETLYPNKLCDYMFDLSQLFNKFYEECPVLNAEAEELRASRLLLCAATAHTLKLGLNLLGIETLDKI